MFPGFFSHQTESERLPLTNSIFRPFPEYYKDFYLKLNEKRVAPVSEYVYLYSLFLHFSCVLHADMGIQHICNNMVRKNQESIEKFLDYLFKIGRCERAIVQTAIEEAGKSKSNKWNGHDFPRLTTFSSLLNLCRKL